MVDISVLIPVYNVEKYLPRCLNTVLDQTFKGDYEIICVNDGSTDSSGKILEDYASKFDKIKIINQPNSGLSVARNAALELAKGKYTMFVDSDDFIAQNTLERLYDYAQKHSSDVVVFDFHSGTTDLKNVQTHHFKNIAAKYGDNSFNIETAEPFVYRYIPVATWVKFYKTDLIKDLKFEAGLNNQDVPHWDLVYTKAKRVNYLPVPYYFYVMQREDAITQITGEKVFDVFKAFSLSENILRDSGYFEKYKNIHYAHFTCNLVCRMQKIIHDLREKFIQKVKEYSMDIDYAAFDKDDFYPFEKENMKLIRFIKENDYSAIQSKLKALKIW